MPRDVFTPDGARAVTAVAPAKINLHLGVGDARPDGFHDLLTVYRAFFRVWAFFLLEFHLLAVLTWARGNWWALSSLAPSHAALCLLEQVAAHAVLSTRPGYVVSLTHGLAGAFARAARSNLLCLRPLWLLLAWLCGAVLGAACAATRPP